MQAVSTRDRDNQLSEVRSADAALDERVMETAKLTDRRGYGLSVPEFARLLYRGSEPVDRVLAAIERRPELAIAGGLVVWRDRTGGVSGMIDRQSGHETYAAAAEALANDFAGRLASSCPLVRSVSLTGSMSSGGFQPGDDLDVSLVVRDGAKYTAYLWAIGLSVVTSLRNHKMETDEMGALPFLPKIICVNVVWEERQVRPFGRKDKWIAYELLMHRPIIGTIFWDRILRENEWLAEHFPQVFGLGKDRSDSHEAVRMASYRRPGGSFFAFLDRHPRALGLVEPLARWTVFGLHRLVSIYRTHKPEARAREAFVNLVKRPYSVYDVPGREAPIPAAAFDAR